MASPARGGAGLHWSRAVCTNPEAEGWPGAGTQRCRVTDRACREIKARYDDARMPAREGRGPATSAASACEIVFHGGGRDAAYLACPGRPVTGSRNTGGPTTANLFDRDIASPESLRIVSGLEARATPRDHFPKENVPANNRLEGGRAHWVRGRPLPRWH